MSITKKILEYIKEKGLLQSTIAKKLDIPQSNLNRILNSEDIKVSQLIKICEVLEVSPTYFFNELNEQTNLKVESVNSEVNYIQTLYSKEMTSRINEERRGRLLIQYATETIGFILSNKKSLLKNINDDVINVVVKSLLENIFTRYEYGFNRDRFIANIVTIMTNPEDLPFEGKDYDKYFK